MDHTHQIPTNNNGSLTTVGDVKTWLARLNDRVPIRICIIDPVKDTHCIGHLNGMTLMHTKEGQICELPVYIRDKRYKVSLELEEIKEKEDNGS